MSYSWNTSKYIDEVENGTDPGLQEYQRIEIDFVKKTDGLKDKTIIDVGAGYGRILPTLAPLVQSFIAVEIDENELIELQKRVAAHPNCSLVVGSGNNLSNLLPNGIKDPLLLSMQNTLGPWDGDRMEAVRQLAEVARRDKGQVILSIFRRESLESWGISMYRTVEGVTGKYDPNTSDIAGGDFRTSSGYLSHWFSKQERDDIKTQLGGSVIREFENTRFYILHVGYS